MEGLPLLFRGYCFEEGTWHHGGVWKNKVQETVRRFKSFHKVDTEHLLHLSWSVTKSGFSSLKCYCISCCFRYIVLQCGKDKPWSSSQLGPNRRRQLCALLSPFNNFSSGCLWCLCHDKHEGICELASSNLGEKGWCWCVKSCCEVRCDLTAGKASKVIAVIAC